MILHLCGGSFKRIINSASKIVFECDHCGKILTLYIRPPLVAIQTAVGKGGKTWKKM